MKTVALLLLLAAPLAAQQTTVTITQTTTTAFTIDVYRSLLITTESLPIAFTGVPYEEALEVTGPPNVTYVWSIDEGELPPGLTLDSLTGVISGVPDSTFVGTADFVVRVNGTINR